MTLPAWTDKGLLPPGAHKAELADLYERFVLDAPYRERRELLFGALTTHLQLIKTVIPAGTAWIDGSFATRHELPPDDVDVVIIPADRAAVASLSGEAKAHLYALLTLQNVSIDGPAVLWFSKLQPVGGVIDAYLCRPGQEPTWQDTWSCVTDGRGTVLAGHAKGYAEVVW